MLNALLPQAYLLKRKQKAVQTEWLSRPLRLPLRVRSMRSFPTAWSLANVPPDDRLTLRPASEASSRSRAKLRFSSRTLCPLAASFRREDVVLGKPALLVERDIARKGRERARGFASMDDDKQQLGILRLLAIISLHRRKCRPCS